MLDALILWLLSSILAASVAALVLLLWGVRSPPPSVVAPLVTLSVALLLVLAAGVALPPVAGPVGQAATVLMIAWGGWMLSARV